MTLQLLSIEPTMFFVERDGTLLQMAEVVVENSSQAIEAVLDAKFPGGRQSTELGKVMVGKSTHQVYVPEIDEATPVEFVLMSRGEACDHRQTTWQPQRHWEVYMVPITHHDVGYLSILANREHSIAAKN